MTLNGSVPLAVLIFNLLFGVRVAEHTAVADSPSNSQAIANSALENKHPSLSPSPPRSPK